MNYIYIVDINDSIYDIDSLRNSLPQCCLDRVDKYKVSKDQLRSLIGWYLVNQKIDFNENLLIIDENNKPIVNGKYFNISHSESLVCVMISDEECGIDVEIIDQEKERIAKKVLSNSEYIIYKTEGLDYLFKIWTAKEAISKTTGHGINFEYLSMTADLSKVHSQKVYDSKGNNYYLSYVSSKIIDITKVSKL